MRVTINLTIAGRFQTTFVCEDTTTIQEIKEHALSVFYIGVGDPDEWEVLNANDDSVLTDGDTLTAAGIVDTGSLYMNEKVAP